VKRTIVQRGGGKKRSPIIALLKKKEKRKHPISTKRGVNIEICFKVLSEKDDRELYGELPLCGVTKKRYVKEN